MIIAEEKDSNNFSAWLADDEKYALIGLKIKLLGSMPQGLIAPHLEALSGIKFDISPHWQQWLGSIRTEEVQDCNLFLASKLPSPEAGILNDETSLLQKRVSDFYLGLLLSGSFTPTHNPVMLTGSRRAGEVDIRQWQNFDRPIPRLSVPDPAVLAQDIQRAAKLAGNIGAFNAVVSPGGNWRFNRVLNLYAKTRSIPDGLERIHQYCRCIEGMIFPTAGETGRHFKSRTELFIGPRHHAQIDEIYKARNNVEHLHEDLYLESFDRDTRLNLLESELIVEFIARNILVHILDREKLWFHFANRSGLAAFWTLAPVDRKQIWGDPFNPLDALADFDPLHFTDGHLGAT